MPRYSIDRATNFIVEQESWTVVQYDHTSVPGIIYLSLTEGKINSIYDDVENNLADTNNIANYQIAAPTQQQNFQVGAVIKPAFTLMKNGQVYDGQYQYISSDKSIAKIINGELKAVGEGIVDITVQLKDFPSIKKVITIQVNNEQQSFLGYIQGNDTIRLNRISYYKLVGTSEISGNQQIEFSLNNNKFAKIIQISDQDNIEMEKRNIYCKIKANDDNQLGEIILTATYNGNTYTKNISIVPLW